MQVVKRYNDYITKRLEGESVISRATKYGYSAMSFATNLDSFVVAVLETKGYSFFEYHVKNGRFSVKDYVEEISPAMMEITPDLLQDDAVIRWWKNIFYEREGACTYDPYYNSCKIADGSEVTFKKIIEELSKYVESIIGGFSEHHPSLKSSLGVSQVFLTGELAKNPLFRYVMQEQNKHGKVAVLPENQQAKVPDENQIVTLPDEKLAQLSLNVTNPIDFKRLVDDSVNITFPLDSMDGDMMAGKSWKEVLVNEQEDYSVGDLKFKTLRLQVECDAFQNIFLLCRDLSGNRKVIQFN